MLRAARGNRRGLLAVASREAQLPGEHRPAGRLVEVGRQLLVRADRCRAAVSQSRVSGYDSGCAEMELPPSHGAEILVHGLTEKQVDEGNLPAGRGLALEQKTCALGFAERRGSIGSADDLRDLGKAETVPE